MASLNFAHTKIVCFGILVLITSSASGQEDIVLKKMMEPCSIVFSQVHCTEAEYETDEDECILQKSDDCDRSLELYCVSGVCQPNCHPLKENYDHIDGKCYRKISADCRTSLECEKNAVCERRKCQCSSNFTLEPQTGKCARAAGYGEFCNSTINCDMSSDIVCRNDKCECKSPEKQFYHLRRKRCYIKIGHKCNGGLQFCPDNSNCLREIPRNELFNEADEPEDEPYLGIGIYDEEEKDFKCKCEKDHGPTEDTKACLGLFGKTCNSLHKCQTEKSLKCYNGTCQCAEPKIQYYDTKLQKCQYLVSIGMQCDTDGSCVEFAHCKSQEKDTSIKKCECISGFISSVDGNCMKDHGQNCSLLLDESPWCNIFAGLECSNATGTCQCMDQEKFYDMKLHECRDFEIAPRNIPAIHFGTSDREYMFEHMASTSPVRVSNLELRFLIGIFCIMKAFN